MPQAIGNANKVNGKQQAPRTTYYISLDLGSDSTAAYCEDPRGNGEMIDLQEHAYTLLGRNVNYLMESATEKSPSSRSPRLRTRFTLEDKRQPSILGSDHAQLDFLERDPNTQDFVKAPGYDKSLFVYFHGEGESLGGRKILPNPKIPFQEGADAVIPSLVTTDSNPSCHYKPVELLQHLVTHIVRNFILKSKTLRIIKGDPRSPHVNPKDIHLILTVPNVYSITHVESIREFVQEHTGVGQVETLYESDALANYALRNPSAQDSAEFKKFIDARDALSNKEELRIVTIDVGRGTTDLSLITIESTPNKGRKTGNDDKGADYTVQSRIGKSDGGNRLSYILANYYNERLRETFQKFKDAKKNIGSLSFDFLSGSTPMSVAQAVIILNHFANLVEEVKKKITKDYTLKPDLTPDRQKALLEPVINALLKSVDAGWVASLDYVELKKALIIAMTLPEKLLPESTRKRWRTWGKSSPQSREEAARIKLVDEIKQYVETNIKNLIDQLKEMAENQESKNTLFSSQKTLWRKFFSMFNDSPHNAFHPSCTIVLVGGQASLFEPIQDAIRNIFDDMNLPEQQVHFLSGKEAKEACCKGAVEFKAGNYETTNFHEIHGTYGFLAKSFGSPRFKPVMMNELNKGAETNVEFDRTASYYFVYCPRFYPYHNGSKIPDDALPKRYDGTTAVITLFEKSRLFKVRYDIDTRQLIVNDNTVSEIVGVGKVEEDIYPKVWPEIVEPWKT